MSKKYMCKTEKKIFVFQCKEQDEIQKNPLIH
jgi:hypothetical protein